VGDGLSTNDPFANLLRSQRLATLAAYAVIWVMINCVAAILIGVGEQVAQGWQGQYLFWFCAFVSAEAIFAMNVLGGQFEKTTLLYRVSEFVLILVLLKVVQFFNGGWGAMVREISTWQTGLEAIFNSEYLLSLFPVVIAWGFTTVLAQNVEAMQSYETDLEVAEFVQLRSERLVAREQIQTIFIGMGLFQIVLVTMARMDLEAMQGLLGKFSGSLAVRVEPLVVYFLAGFVLLSLCQFAILRGAWVIGKIPAQVNIGKNWIRSAFFIFGVAAVVVLLLPTSYTRDLLQTAGYAFAILFQVLSFLVGLLLFPFFWLYAWLISLFRGESSTETSVSPPQMDFQPAAEAAGGMPDWLELLRNIIFWVVLLAGMGYFIWQYIRQNRAVLQAVTNFKPLIWLARIWRWLRGQFRLAQTQIQAAINQRRQAAQLKRQLSMNNKKETINLRQANARQKLLFYYQSFLQRSDQAGLKRKSSQTPNQYAREMTQSLPEEIESVTTLTEGFIAARYNARPVQDEQAENVEPFWKRVMKALKQKQHNQKK
jgi:hypothetical protein